MGLCASSQIEKGDHDHHQQDIKKSATSTIKIIHEDGKLQELKQPTRARNIMIIKSQNTDNNNPNIHCFLCSSESMSVGACAPQVQDDEYLQLGQLYFMLPLSQAHKPLSLHDLCALAVKANSALGHTR